MPADFEAIFAEPAKNWDVNGKEGASTKRAGLALSGGGYRAMLFHVGALRRLHEVGALQHITRVSSVSGGSIAAAVLAQAWPKISVTRDSDVFEAEVQHKLWNISDKRIDIASGVVGALRPGQSIAETVAKKYDKLFPNYGLQDRPLHPRFVFCATNLGTGSILRFARPYTADSRVGKRDNLDLPLSDVLAASAAFPPVLSPMRFHLGESEALTEQFDETNKPDLADTEFAEKLELADGGVYDNLGLQPLDQYHTLLVSDGGGPFQDETKVKTNWLQHMIRNWLVTDNQVRSLRRSNLVAAYETDRRNGAFWGISTPYGKYTKRVLDVDDRWAHYLNAIPTRLHPFDELARQQLINFSYAMTDAALRTYVLPEGATIPDPQPPFPEVSLAGRPPSDRYEAPPIWKVWK